MWKYTQHSFAGGVQDTRLQGRQDLEWYRIAATTLDNFMVKRQGCIQKRRGTNCVAKFGEKIIRIIPFVYERTKSYLLAFSKDKEGISVKVYDSAENAVSQSFTADLTEAAIANCRYVQTGDVVILVGEGMLPSRITRSAGGVFTFDKINFTNLGGAALPGAPSIRVEPGENKDANGNERTVYYAATAVATDGRETLLGEAKPMTYRTPWTNTFVVKVSILDSAGNVLDNPPQGVSHYNIYKKTSGEFGFIGTTKGHQTITREMRDEHGNIIYHQKVDENGNPVYEQKKDENGKLVYEQMVDEDGNPKVDENGNPVYDMTKPVYDETKPVYDKTNPVTETVNTVIEFQDDFITPDTSLTPPKRESFFESTDLSPTTVALVNQRLVFAATKNSPYTVWWSTVGDFFNFNDHETVRDDDGFSANIPATELPRINHIISTRDMLIFSDGAEWIAEPVSGEALTLKSLTFKQQSQVGASAVLPPTMIEDKVVFADATCETVHTIDYNLDRDGYKTQNVTILSQSLFDGNPIKAWAYAQHPDSTLWCVLDDGTIATLAYMQEHELVAWSHQTLGGGMKALDVVCTKEVLHGNSAVYILATNDLGEYLLLRVREEVTPSTLDNGLCLDAMEKVVGEGRPVPMGKVAIDELNGEERRFLSHGRTYYVGYPYEATFRSVKPEAQMQGGQTIQFELKDAISAELRLRNVTDFTVVPTALEGEAYQDVAYNAPTKAYNGSIKLEAKDVTLELAGHSNTSGAITLRCDAPYPLMVLSMAINYELDPRTIGVN